MISEKGVSKTSKYTVLMISFQKKNMILKNIYIFVIIQGSFQPWPPLNYMFKIFLVISSLRFPDKFTSSMNIFQNTNFKYQIWGWLFL